MDDVSICLSGRLLSTKTANLSSSYFESFIIVKHFLLMRQAIWGALISWYLMWVMRRSGNSWRRATLFFGDSPVFVQEAATCCLQSASCRSSTRERLVFLCHVDRWAPGVCSKWTCPLKSNAPFPPRPMMHLSSKEFYIDSAHRIHNLNAG